MKKIIMSLIILSCLLLSGCGNKQEAVENTVVTDWEKGFTVWNTVEEQPLSVVAYEDVAHTDVQGMTFQYTPKCVVNGSSYYTLQQMIADGQYKSFIKVHAVGEEKPIVKGLDFASWELTDGVIWSFDVIPEGERKGYVFAVGTDWTEMSDGSRCPGASYLVYVDEEGKFVSKEKSTPKQGEVTYQKVFVDGEGYVYLLENDGHSVRVLDEKGKQITEYSCPEGEQNCIFTPIRDERNQLVIPMKLGAENKVKLLYRSGKVMKELASLPGNMTAWYAFTDNRMYCGDGEDVYCWDVSNGQCNKLFAIADTGVLKTDSVYMIPVEQNEICVRVVSKKEDFAVTMGELSGKVAESLQIAFLSGENALVSGNLVNYNRKNPLYQASCETLSEEERDRALLEVVNGGGPDILYVSQEDMEKLASQGALADLGQYISEQTRQVIAPGIIELGTYKNKFVGIASDFTVRTLYTSKETWDKEGWSLEEMLTLAEERDDTTELMTFQFGSMEPELVLSYLLMDSLEATPYVDMESGKSRFEEKNFVKVLEAVKKYAPNEGGAGMEGEDRVAKGTCLALYDPVFEPDIFFRKLSKIGDTGYAVGFPAEEGYGNYIADTGVFVVNANAKNKNAIKAFLEFMLSVETQARLEHSLSVRQDITDTTVIYNAGAKKYFWVVGGMDMILLDQKSDGTTYTEEYKAFIKSCVPSRGNGDIMKIVEEEATAYFAGSKDALSVVRLIDNRVQLYLDERK